MQQGVLIYRLVSDFLCAAAAFAFQYLYYVLVPPNERGFGCNDSSLTYPVVKSFQSVLELLIYFYIVPVILFFIVEAAVFPWTDPNVKKINYLVNVYKIFVTFTFGIYVIFSIVVFVKLTVGRLRPHFMNACKPDVECSSPENRYRYVSEYSCMSENTGRVREARQSFPSGHSTGAVQSATFIAMYLDAKISWDGVNLVKRAVEFVIFTAGVATAVSRVSDYKHHWTDVLAGIALGFSGALWMAFWMTDLYKSKKLARKESQESD